MLAFYHNGSNWLQSGFSPANPLANTATNTTSPNFNPGNYNFQVCCNKNNINYGCSTQQPVAINTCPTPTPGVPGTPVVNVTPPICTNSNSTWAWSPVSNAVSYDIERHTAVSYTHLRAHETVLDLVCRLLLEKTKKHTHTTLSDIQTAYTHTERSREVSNK